MNFINFNGKIVPAAQPILPAQNRACRYGDGLFETIKYKNEKLILAHEHFNRLEKGLQLFQYQIPKWFTPQYLILETEKLLKKNNLKDSRVRIQIIRQQGGLYDLNHPEPHFIIETTPLPNGADHLNVNGLQLGFYRDAKKTRDAFSNLKHSNFLPYFMAALMAKKNKWNDALVFNDANRVCDSTIANIFVIKQHKLFTTPLSEGCIAGVMRNFLMEALPKIGFSVLEKPFTAEDILQADEVFLTNSIYPIRWVAGIDKVTFLGHQTAKIYELLQQNFPNKFI